MGRNNLMAWIFAFLLAVNLVSAAEIRGTVTDENGEPLYGAIVSFEYKGVRTGTTTNEDGSFRVTGIDPGNYYITFSLIGSKEHSRTVSTSEEIEILLDTQALTLPTIIVSTDRFTQQELENRQTLFPVIEAKPFNPYSDLGSIYGNSEFASEEPIPIYPGNYLVLDGSKSQFENAPLGNIYMSWYVGIPSFEF